MRLSVRTEPARSGWMTRVHDVATGIGVKEAHVARFGWGVLAYNVAVILLGAWVRVTGSGAGCGSHWPTCNGEVVPLSPSVKTLTEFSHRASSGVSVVLTLILLVATFAFTRKAHPARRAAVASAVLLMVEALLGAALVLFKLVVDDASSARVVVMGAHLVNTLLLLGAFTFTAWHLSGGPRLQRSEDDTVPRALGWALAAIILVVMTGGIAALGDTLYPATSLTAGMAQDLNSATPWLLRVRVLHPTLAVITAILVFGVALHVRSERESPRVRSRALWVCALVVVQVCLGALNVALLAPSALQIIHLFVGDAVWIAMLLLTAEALSGPATAARAAPQAHISG